MAVDRAALHLLLDHAAAVVYLAGVALLYLPHAAVLQPAVGQLHLVAVHDLLAEQAVLVADRAAHRGHVQRRQRVQEARRKTPQTAVAQAWIVLLLGNGVQRDVQILQRLLIVVGAYKVQYVVVQRAAHQELHRQVVDAARLFLVAQMARLHEFIHDLVADGQRDGLVDLLLGRLVQRAAELALQVPHDGVLDPVNVVNAFHFISSKLNGSSNNPLRLIVTYSTVRYKKKSSEIRHISLFPDKLPRKNRFPRRDSTKQYIPFYNKNP